MLQGEALPIDIRVLAGLAQKCHAYAKALHYKVRMLVAAAAVGTRKARTVTGRGEDPCSGLQV